MVRLRLLLGNSYPQLTTLSGEQCPVVFIEAHDTDYAGEAEQGTAYYLSKSIMKIPNMPGKSHRGTERTMRKASYRARVKVAGGRGRMRRSSSWRGK